VADAEGNERSLKVTHVTSMKQRKRTIRVICVDDHPLVRDGVSFKIGRQSDMRVIGAASSTEEALALYRRCRPDVVLIYLLLPGMGGTRAIESIRREDPNARIIALTTYGTDEDIHRALQAGAASLLLKDSLSSELIRTIRAVHRGERPLPADVASRLAARASHPDLSPREVEVLELLVQGSRNKEIGDRLGITRETVQSHMKRLYAKLDVHDRTAAVMVALSRGIVGLKEPSRR
jgi:two-component system NarL family response regulator